jgi:hypothetical protein
MGRIATNIVRKSFTSDTSPCHQSRLRESRRASLAGSIVTFFTKFQFAIRPDN